MTGYESKRAAARDKLDGMDREALKLALEALQFSGNIWHMDCKKDEAIAAIKEALAQPAQEPVAWMNKHGDCKSAVFREAEAGAKEEYNIPLYTNQTLEKNT